MGGQKLALHPIHLPPCVQKSNKPSPIQRFDLKAKGQLRARSVPRTHTIFTITYQLFTRLSSILQITGQA